uniref:Thyroid hormone receptor interactor 10 n=1 Tax=Nothobranchius furzeri TaxID=105023 RepID=A0A8C6KBC0_NOTFU
GKWGWDQYDVIDKHTQSGLDLAERYIKFVKERSEIEQTYAKLLRNLTKKYLKRGHKDEQDCKYSNYASFQDILAELNDYAGQRELIAENMIESICNNLSKYLQELKQERKNHLSDARKAQQSLDSSLKHLESKRFAKEWAEAEKTVQQVERLENDPNSTKLDVEKAKHVANARTRAAEECRNDYAAELQKYNKEQNCYYYVEIPQIFNKLQDLDENRIRKMAEGYCKFSDIEKNVLPIISRCLEGITAAGTKIDEKQDSLLFIEQNKSGFERPADVEFEDYTQGIKVSNSDTILNQPKLRPKLRLFRKHKVSNVHSRFHLDLLPVAVLPLGIGRRPKEEGKKRAQSRAAAEDFSHLPPEQRKKKLQAKIDDISKDLQKEQDQSDALEKMKDVYVKNSQLGDPARLEPQICQTNQKIGHLKGELAKYETWLSEAVGGEESSNNTNNNSQHSLEMTSDPSQNIYTDFDEFDDIEMPVGQCTALYTFEGNNEGTISIMEGELLTVMEKDKGDGWMRVLRASGEEGYIPSSYVKINA